VADLVVLVPTRDEAANVATVVRRVCDALAPVPFSWELVFVDDSDDETVGVLAGLAALFPGIELLHRPEGQREGGLSGAVLAGLAATSSRWVAVMDADLQHPPELLPELIGPLADTSADVVVATRFAAGSGCRGLASPWRRAMSRLARAVTRVAIPQARTISDPLGGFFAFDRAVLDSEDIRPDGFKLLLEVLVRSRWCRTVEVPYQFGARCQGHSKTDLHEGIRFLRQIARLWLQAGTHDLAGSRHPGSVRQPVAGPVA
jgi:glycosyltransferase involved in cell wall biosynthesis